MIHCDNIIESLSIILRNLNINANNTELDKWTDGLTGYGFYSVLYETKLTKGHYYYLRFTYKFTTTNQSPKWCNMYFLGGYINGAAITNNPTANTEYTASAVVLMTALYQTDILGTIYNGDSNAINGVTSYVKNVLVYDVTSLYQVLRAKGLATNSTQLKTWCDNNLEFVPRYTDYDATDKIDTFTKVHVYKGALIGKEIIETEGMNFYSAQNRYVDNYFDVDINNVAVYNNKGNGTVTRTRVMEAEQLNSPFKNTHKYILKILTSGEASPGAGGFVITHWARADAVFVEKFVAKIPVGYYITAAWNTQGTGSQVSYLSSRDGTGKWEEYTILYRCGSSGNFSTGGYVYLQGSGLTDVTWYLSYANNCDITSNPDLAYYTVLPGKTNIKNGVIATDAFNTNNLIVNGDCRIQTPDMISSTWSYDTTDYAGNAFASIVLPVGAGSGRLQYNIKINPTERYKISMWIKCKADMSSFLVAIIPYVNSSELSHSRIIYKPNTKTLLTQALNPGDTIVKVKSTANWAVMNYAQLGFRSTLYKSYNDLGISGRSGVESTIASIDSDTQMTLRIPYAGDAKPINTYVVESSDGGTYPYPISKSNLPGDNTWKYVEGYFGADSRWDGAGTTWAGLPWDCTHVKLVLNLYANSGTVPIKYSDIRIESVSTDKHAHRQEEKIQISKTI